MRGGLATSTDGVHWERVAGSGAGGSILDIGAAGEHDANFIGKLLSPPFDLSVYV
jgi:hypothetical protein